jgi:hypothetical protein
MTQAGPTKRSSALATLPFAIAAEIGLITIGAGGAVFAVLVFLLLCGASHQTRRMRSRRQAAV